MTMVCRELVENKFVPFSFDKDTFTITEAPLEFSEGASLFLFGEKLSAGANDSLRRKANKACRKVELTEKVRDLDPRHPKVVSVRFLFRRHFPFSFPIFFSFSCSCNLPCHSFLCPSAISLYPFLHCDVHNLFVVIESHLGGVLGG